MKQTCRASTHGLSWVPDKVMFSFYSRQHMHQTLQQEPFIVSVGAVPQLTLYIIFWILHDLLLGGTLTNLCLSSAFFVWESLVFVSSFGRFVNRPDTGYIVEVRVPTWFVLAVVSVTWFLEFLIETKGTGSMLCETLHWVVSKIRVRLPVSCA